MSNQKEVNDLIKRLSGQSNILTIPRIYIDITGDHLAALFLSQCVYWSDKGHGGWFYKSEKEWNEELELSPYQVKRIRKDLDRFIETDLRKANGAPTIHYHVRMDELSKAIIEKLNNGLRGNSTMDCEETQQSDYEETQQSLTETTTRLPTESNDDTDDFFRQVMIATGIMATQNDIPLMNEWKKSGVSIEDVKAAIIWRVDNGKKAVKTISQLAGGVDVSHQRRAQGFTNKPAQTTVNGVTVIQARD